MWEYKGILILESADFTTTAGDNNDVLVEASVFQVTPSNNNDSITGLRMGFSPQGAQTPFVSLANAHTTNSLVLKNQNTGSVVGNRLFCPGGTDFILPPLYFIQIALVSALNGWLIRQMADVRSAVTPVSDGSHTIANALIGTDGTVTTEKGLVTGTVSSTVL